MNLACEGSNGRFIYPIFMLVSNLSISALHPNNFKVMLIKGLSIARYVYPRSHKVGCLCLMWIDIPQKHFFDYFYEEITCNTVNIRRELHNSLYATLSNDDGIFSLRASVYEDIVTCLIYRLWHLTEELRRVSKNYLLY